MIHAKVTGIVGSIVLGLAHVLVVLCASVWPAAALEIVLNDVAPDRVERQRAALRGQLPLPGTPDIAKLKERLAAKSLKRGSAVLVRVFKEDSELELWMRSGDTYVRFATYPICQWSGTLGPKLKEGDHQAPEGIYSIRRRQLRRHSRWPRSIHLNFPNTFDQMHARTGSWILVHGGCSSVGCFAMTNPVLDEIFGLVRAAMKAGQKRVPLHVFPFRMTDANLARHRSSQWLPFWQTLKIGHDMLERTGVPPKVAICNKRYAFAPGGEKELAGKTAAIRVRQSRPMSAAQTCFQDHLDTTAKSQDAIGIVAVNIRSVER